MNITLDTAMENIKQENPDLDEAALELIRDNTQKFIEGLTKDNFRASCQSAMEMKDEQR